MVLLPPTLGVSSETPFGMGTLQQRKCLALVALHTLWLSLCPLTGLRANPILPGPWS